MRKSGLALLLACALAAAPTARAASPATGPAAQAAALTQGLATIGKSQGKTFADRYAAFAPVIDQVFDIETFLKASVGLRYGSLSAADQTTLTRVFRAYMIASYVSNFSDNGAMSFAVEPDLRESGADRIVTTDLIAAGGEKTPIAYVMRQTATGWRAVDVLVNGTISQAAVQRSDFRAQLAGEANAAKLIGMLTDKVKTLSAGSITP